MEPRDRVLYHQIHPLKLGGDIGADLVSLPLIWTGRRRLGMLIHWATPVVASAVVLPRTADLERLRESSAGRYVNHEMTPPMQAIRLIGDAITVAGAWRRRADWIALGGLVVAAGWTVGPGGLFRGRDARRLGARRQFASNSTRSLEPAVADDADRRLRVMDSGRSVRRA
jgi:hypothetical protein